MASVDIKDGAGKKTGTVELDVSVLPGLEPGEPNGCPRL